MKMLIFFYQNALIFLLKNITFGIGNEHEKLIVLNFQVLCISMA